MVLNPAQNSGLAPALASRSATAGRGGELPFPLLAPLIVLSLVNINLYLTPSYPVPHFYGFLFVAVAFLHRPSGFTADELKFLYLLLLFPAASLFLADMQFFPGRLKGFLAYVYSIGFGLLFYRAILQNTPECLRRCLTYILAMVLILLTLERYTPMQGIFSDLRYFLHPTSVYDSDARDLAMVGFIRPKLIWREPAHVAQFVTLMIWCLAILSPKRLSAFVIGTGLVAVAYALIGSPIIILTILGLFVIFLPMLFRQTSLPTACLCTILTLAALAIGVILSGRGALPSIAGEERIAAIMSGEDGSFQKRISIPASTAKNVVADYPLFGLGISGTEAGFQHFSNAYAAFGIRLYDDGSWHTKIHSTVVNVIISFGVVGSLIYLACFCHAFNILVGTRGLMLLLALLAIFQLSRGSIVTPHFWIPVCLLAGVIRQPEVSNPGA